MKRFLIGAIAVCTLITGSAHPQSKPDVSIANRIRAYLAAFAATGNLTGTVLVARNGQILFEQSYGMANYDWQIPNSAKTRFHIASSQNHSPPSERNAYKQASPMGRFYRYAFFIEVNHPQPFHFLRAA